MVRPIILHFHIFKNAGQTLDWTLEKNFRESFVLHSYQDPPGPLSLEKVLEYFKNNENLVAFSSHRIRFPIPESNLVNIIPIFFVRNPIDRAGSIYHFVKNKNSNDSLETIAAKKLDLKEFILWSFKNSKKQIENQQVRFISQNHFRPMFSKFSTACKYSKKSLCGIVERFDDSMVVIEENLKKKFKNIDLSYKAQNVNIKRKKSLAEKLEEIEGEIGKNLFHELQKKNEFDQKLCSFVNEQLEQKIKLIKDFDSKLENYKQRCKDLEKGNSKNEFEKTIFHS